eukprot:3403086-Pyramimonas_sp.AAC.1
MPPSSFMICCRLSPRRREQKARGRERSWKEWLLKDLDQGGGRTAHSWTRPVEAWVPSSTPSAAGQVVPDPQSLLRAEVKRFRALWIADTE